MVSSAEIEQEHRAMTGPGSFYERNGGRFKNQHQMSRDEEYGYVATILAGGADHEAQLPGFSVGDRVEKFTGDYQLVGEVRSVFTTKAGKVRLVVEHEPGFLHIYGEQNIRLASGEAASVAAHAADCPWNDTRLTLHRSCTCGAHTPRYQRLFADALARGRGENLDGSPRRAAVATNPDTAAVRQQIDGGG